MATHSEDSRLKKSSGDTRTDRPVQDAERVDNDGSAFSQEERRRMFRNEWTQEALPSVPQIPGFHLCWLSSTSTYDPIHKRMRMGYEPVKTAEVPGYEHLKMKSGEFEGVVSINEMVLFKVPMERYQEIMSELHHYAPLDEEGKIRSQLDLGHRDSNGRRLGEVDGDGFESLSQNRKVPQFT